MNLYVFFLYHPDVLILLLRWLSHRTLTSHNDMLAPLPCSLLGAKITRRNVNKLPNKHTDFGGPLPAFAKLRQVHFGLIIGIPSVDCIIQPVQLKHCGNYIAECKMFYVPERKKCYSVICISFSVSFPCFLLSEREALSPIH